MTDWIRKASQPVDFASLVAFRILFGLTLAVACARALASGWVEEVLVEPTFFFKYPGFAWVPVPSGPVLQALLAGLVLCALGIAAGLFYRLSAFLFLVGFSWLQLMDLTNYLNHYYLVVVLCGLLVVLPLGRFGSLDARRRPERALQAAPAGWIWLLRGQLALVYLHAGLAKANPDWLLHGQPLGIWLSARTDTPVLGPLFALEAAPLVMSWAGFLYDTTIAGWLLWRRTRPLAYGAVLAFHGVTQVLFDIGMFPTIMVTSTLIFFGPSWPRRWVARRAWAPSAPPAPRARPWLAAACAWLTFQAVFPLRCHLVGENVLWDEQGMRWSWRVMVREKMGSVTYRVTQDGREVEVNPKHYLAWRQLAEMSGQPGHIRQLAHHIADDFRRRGGGEPQVRVDAWVSLNGRPPARLVDPTVDLVHLGPDTPWILPAPEGPPLARDARASR